MKIISLIILISINLSLADRIDDRRNKIIKIINEELSEVQRLNGQRNNRDPNLLLRMAELNLEKARLWKEKENKDFLSIPIKKRRKLNKKRYFRQSNKYFNEANRLCRRITKRFKGFNKIGEVYYILGFNAKESNNQNLAAKYLYRATKKSRNSQTKVKSQISLAEVNYNQKRYRKAIPLYESALSKYNDKWWTKDSFNLAWSYYRVEKYSKAISKMLDVYKRSSNKKYIDMSSQVERDIGLFYASANRVNDGIKFYKKIGINFTDQLLRVALSLISQGKYTKANKVLYQAEKYEKRKNKLLEINIEQLVLYEKFSKFNNHQTAARKIYVYFKEKKLNDSQLKTFKFQLAKVAAILQKQVVSKTYKRVPKVRFAKANQAIEYFEYLTVLAANKRDEYNYLKAETAFATGMKTRAFEYYKKTFETSKSDNKKTFLVRSMNGMIASLGAKKGTNVVNNIYVFEEYISRWPKGKRAKDIYSRLFRSYLSQNEYNKAKSVLERYSVAYRKDYKTQEAMIANLMDIDRKARDNKKIRAWITDIDNKKYLVSTKYARKLKELLTTIQIENVQTELNKGNKKVALVGYHKIINDPYSTKRSKINAKYNLAALYFELNDTINASLWANSALDEMSGKDVLKFSESFITISNFLFTSLSFKKSSELSEKYVTKICKYKRKSKRTALKNSAFIYLADGNISGAERMVSLGKKCRVRSSVIQLIEYEIMKEYKEQKNWVRYEYYINKLKDSKNYYPQIIDELIYAKELHQKFNNVNKVKKYNTFIWRNYYRAKKARRNISMSSLDYIAKIKLIEMDNLVAKLNLVRFEFPEKVFAKRQKLKLDLLSKLTSVADEIQAIGSGVGIVQSFKKLELSYLKVSEEILNFTPRGKSKEYIKAFKNDFNQVGSQIKLAAKEYRSEAIRAINNNEILNVDNILFQKNPIPIQYIGNDVFSLMDKGGNK